MGSPAHAGVAKRPSPQATAASTPATDGAPHPASGCSEQPNRPASPAPGRLPALPQHTPHLPSRTKRYESHSRKPMVTVFQMAAPATRAIPSSPATTTGNSRRPLYHNRRTSGQPPVSLQAQPQQKQRRQQASKKKASIITAHSARQPNPARMPAIQQASAATTRSLPSIASSLRFPANSQHASTVLTCRRRFPHNPPTMTAQKKEKRTALILLAATLLYVTVCAFSVIAEGWASLIWEAIGLCVVGSMLGIAHLLHRHRKTHPPPD